MHVDSSTWFKPKIYKYKLKELSKRNDIPGLLHFVVYFLSLFLFVYLSFIFWGTWFFFIFFFIYSIIYTFDELPATGESLTLLTFLHITENKHTLYGFSNIQERQLFKMLIGVSGIGPKIAIQLLSSTHASQFNSNFPPVFILFA